MIFLCHITFVFKLSNWSKGRNKVQVNDLSFRDNKGKIINIWIKIIIIIINNYYNNYT